VQKKERESGDETLISKQAVLKKIIQIFIKKCCVQTEIYAVLNIIHNMPFMHEANK
jgi:hypothetical protein